MLIIPLGTHRDDQTRLPLLTLLVCVICIAAHILVTREATKLAYAYDPRTWHVGHMISAVFLHANVPHLVGNLFFFYCFSGTIEKEISAKWYVAAFLVFAVVTHVSFALLTKVYLPSLGLSGVVWGFMGLFIARFPFDSVECFVWFLWIIRRVAVPAIIFVLGYLALDIGALHQHEPGVNHVAHLAGFLAGAMLVGFWGVMERDQGPRAVRQRTSIRQAATPSKATLETIQEHDWR